MCQQLGTSHKTEMAELDHAPAVARRSHDLEEPPLRNAEHIHRARLRDELRRRWRLNEDPTRHHEAHFDEVPIRIFCLRGELLDECELASSGRLRVTRLVRRSLRSARAWLRRAHAA